MPISSLNQFASADNYAKVMWKEIQGSTLTRAETKRLNRLSQPDYDALERRMEQMDSAVCNRNHPDWYGNMPGYTKLQGTLSHKHEVRVNGGSSNRLYFEVSSGQISEIMYGKHLSKNNTLSPVR